MPFTVLFLLLFFILHVSTAVCAEPDLVYKVEDMDNVSCRSDIIYKESGNMDLKMDIYYSLDSDSRKTETVILIHGVGPVRSYKDTAGFNSWGRLLAAKGLNAITFNWRPGRSSGDVSDLIEFVYENQDSLKINGNKLNVFAFSAGVKECIPEVLKTGHGIIESIVVYYGELDDNILNDEMNNSVPPMLIVMAANDRIISPACNDDFVRRARKMGYKISYQIHKTGGHGFELLNDNSETSKIIEETIRFIKQN